jgi:signal peptidase I
VTVRLLTALYTLAIYAYPRDFRRRFGTDLRQTFRDRCAAAFRDPSIARIARFLWTSVTDFTITLIEERLSAMFDSLRANKRRLVYAAAITLAVLAAPLTVLRLHVIAAPSMENTLRVGDRVIVSKLIGDLRQGDVVVFRNPGNPSQNFVRRVIGLPGDTIEIRNKEVHINGNVVDDPHKTHVDSTTYTPDTPEYLRVRDNYGPVTVPPDRYFVLGDNRDNSLDSRYFGFVSRDDMVARPWFIYWHGSTGK